MKKIAILFLFFAISVYSQNNLTINLEWNGMEMYSRNDEYTFKYPVFKGETLIFLFRKEKYFQEV